MLRYRLSSLRSLRRSAAFLAAGFFLGGCTSGADYSPLLNAEPAVGSTITERLPRTLRLFYAALPNVDVSTVTLTGPEGEYTLRGLHTMGADDLMMEIYRPTLTNGDYTVKWETQVEGDSQTYSGEYQFSVALP